jgi:hypothetical protein
MVSVVNMAVTHPQAAAIVVVTAQTAAVAADAVNGQSRTAELHHPRNQLDEGTEDLRVTLWAWNSVT